MYEQVKKIILKTKIETNPFPHLAINNLIPKNNLDSLIKVSPGFDDCNEKDIFVSASKTKKAILPDSNIYRKLLKKKVFKELNDTFKKIKPIIVKKFQPFILQHVQEKFQKSNLKYHISFALMRRGYIKGAHVDRRDHLIHALFYTNSQSTKGGDLQILKLKKKKKVYDVFPSKESFKVFKKYKIKKNFCIFTLNVPWSYHSTTMYQGKSDRKYFYAVYDFKIKNSGAELKNRIKGFNLNNFWKDQVKTKSLRRKKIFLSK